MGIRLVKFAPAYVRPEVNVEKEVSALIAAERAAARVLGDAAHDPTSALPRTDIAAEQGAGTKLHHSNSGMSR